LDRVGWVHPHDGEFHYEEATTALVHTDRDNPPVLSAWHAVGELVRKAVATTPEKVETGTGTRFSVAEVFAAAGTLQRRRHGAADPGTALVRGTEMFSVVADTLAAGTQADARHAALHDNEVPSEERYTVSAKTLYHETPEAE